MIINIEELENKPENKLLINFHEIIDELGNNKPVIGEITAQLTTYGVDITGHIETDIMLDCDRCIESFPYHVDIDINEKFIKGSLASIETKELELKEENFVEELQGKTEIDVTDLIHQAIILNVPSKNLCSAECPGSKEYQNLQEEKPIDPRLEVFKRLSENKSQEEE